MVGWVLTECALFSRAKVGLIDGRSGVKAMVTSIFGGHISCQARVVIGAAGCTSCLLLLGLSSALAVASKQVAAWSDGLFSCAAGLLAHVLLLWQKRLQCFLAPNLWLCNYSAAAEAALAFHSARCNAVRVWLSML